MAYLTTAEIATHLYGEVSTEIGRGDDNVLLTAITCAMEEASGYLTAFDQAAIFAAIGDTRNPILLLYIKDISVWHYIQLANPAVEMDLRKYRYEKAIEWLEKVQKGKTNPNLPYVAVAAPEVPSNYLKTGGIDKRNNNF